MTAHDAKLVEAVAIAIWDCGLRKEWPSELTEGEREPYRDDARAALDAINAAGYVLLAPEEIQSAIREIFGTLCDEDLDIAPKEQP